MSPAYPAKFRHPAPACWRALGSWAVGLGLMLPMASAAPNNATDAQCRMTSLARQALDGDAQLGALNLGVSVRDEVATVWGTVPSSAIADRAVNCLRRVPGVARVDNQLTVECPTDPLVDFLKLPPRPLTPKPLPGMRVQEPVEPRSTRTSHGPVPVWHPAAPVPPAPEPKLTSRPEPTAAVAAVTMPVIPLPVLRPAPVPLREEAVPVKAEQRDLSRVIADLQNPYEHLRGVKPEVRGGVVHLRGTVGSWQELQTFARAISQLPGVDRVVLSGLRDAPR